jgi:hypothetical protein
MLPLRFDGWRGHVTDGNFTTSLPGMRVTTFVSQ